MFSCAIETKTETQNNSLKVANSRVLDRTLFVSGADSRIDLSDLSPTGKRFFCFYFTYLKLGYDLVDAPEWVRVENEYRLASLNGHRSHSPTTLQRAERELIKAGLILKPAFRRGGHSKIYFTQKMRDMWDAVRPQKQPTPPPPEKDTQCRTYEHISVHPSPVTPISVDPTTSYSDSLIFNSDTRAIDRTIAHESIKLKTNTNKNTKPNSKKKTRKPTYNPKKPKAAQNRPTKTWLNRVARTVSVMSEVMASDKKISWGDREYAYARARMELNEPNTPNSSGVDWEYVIQTFPKMSYSERDAFIVREVIPLLVKRPTLEVVEVPAENSTPFKDTEEAFEIRCKHYNMTPEELRLLEQARENLLSHREAS